MTTDEYCREIEAYLCRKNDGHLIRIVGPSFERVRGWSSEGIPFKVACQGVDRYFERYYAKGPRRRPVQIDFCEADVREAFEAWSRAVGVRPLVPDASSAADDVPPAKPSRASLPEHLVRVLAVLSSRLAASAPLQADVRSVLEGVANEVSSLGDLPGPFRGEARARAGARLRELDRAMLDAVRRHADAAALQSLRQEAAVELAPFKARMPSPAYEQAISAAVDRLLRQREGLPVVAFE